MKGSGVTKRQEGVTAAAGQQQQRAQRHRSPAPLLQPAAAAPAHHLQAAAEGEQLAVAALGRLPALQRKLALLHR